MRVVLGIGALMAVLLLGCGDDESADAPELPTPAPSSSSGDPPGPEDYETAYEEIMLKIRRGFGALPPTTGTVDMLQQELLAFSSTSLRRGASAMDELSPPPQLREEHTELVQKVVVPAANRLGEMAHDLEGASPSQRQAMTQTPAFLARADAEALLGGTQAFAQAATRKGYDIPVALRLDPFGFTLRLVQLK